MKIFKAKLCILHLLIVCALGAKVFAGVEPHAVVGVNNPRLIVATFAHGTKGTGDGAPVEARVVFTNLRVVDQLQQGLRESEQEDIIFYMYTAVYLIFLDDNMEISDAYVYYPVTKPHGGVLKAEASHISPTRFMVKQEGFDRGRYSAQALEIINELIPEELIWSLKQK